MSSGSCSWQHEAFFRYDATLNVVSDYFPLTVANLYCVALVTPLMNYACLLASYLATYQLYSQVLHFFCGNASIITCNIFPGLHHIKSTWLSKNGLISK